jgi:bifunctional UDP-N-acetylglucosamine pyrophosphorylase / glucosamine-1-phosphate N-acetyltransferase
MSVFNAMFDAPTRISNEAVLRAAFGSDRLYLAADASVTFDGSASLGPDVAFDGECSFGDDIAIGNGSILTNASLGVANRVRPYSLLADVRAGARNLFGPFCFIRDDCVIGGDCILGAHVEAARSTFGSGVKISHRAFVGDAEVGDLTIIGAGVVFCNFDGSGRQATQVGANVILGSGVLLVPPLSVGDGAIIGAGSTLTKDVPAGAKVIQKR